MKLKISTINLLVILSAINLFGSAMTWTGLPIYAFLVTGSPLFTSVLFITSAISNIITTIFGGYIVDKFDKMKIMLVSYISSILIFIALLLSLQFEMFYLLVPLVIINAMFSSTSGIAQNIWINSLVDSKKLVQQLSARNSLFLTAKTLGFAMGPFLFSILMEKALLLDILTYFVCLLILIYMNSSNQTQHIKTNSANKPKKAMTQLVSSFKFVMKDKVLRQLSLLEAVNGMITPTIISVSVYILDIRYDASTLIFSAFWIIGGVGAMLGNLLLSKINVYEWKKLNINLLNNFLVVGGVAIMTLSNNEIGYLVGFSLFTFGTPIMNNLLRAEIFSQAPTEMKAQYKGITLALSDLCKLIFLPLAYLIIDQYGFFTFLILFTILSFIRINYSFTILILNNLNIVRKEKQHA